MILDMDDPFLQRMRIYLHLVPVFGVIPSLWTLYKSESYGERNSKVEERKQSQLQSASRLSVLMGLASISAIALLGAAATQTTQLATLRLLIGSSFIGSSYFLLSLVLMFRVAKGQSMRLPIVTTLSRRLP